VESLDHVTARRDYPYPIATLALAALAFITAIFAGLAFKKQLQEVRAIELQVADGHELTGQQFKLIEIQDEQLREQRKINKLLADDLRESIKERARLRQVAERARPIGSASR
jgi:hypothetical protein